MAKPKDKPKSKATETTATKRIGPVKKKSAKAKMKVTKAKLPTLKPARWKEDIRATYPPLPVPEVLADSPGLAGAQAPKRVRKAEERHLAPLDSGPGVAEPGVLERLWNTVEERRVSGDAETSHSARLLARGTAKVAQKLGEEAVECVIEAMAGNRTATISESADLLYHLMVLWVDAGIRPTEVWAELVRREGISGIAEKASRQHLSPVGVVRAARTTKLP
jgi:phosphoribosyl-ATP pyrophosphohydrolase